MVCVRVVTSLAGVEKKAMDKRGIHRWAAFKTELWVQVQLASPVVLANVLWYGVLVVNMVFIGHVEASPQLISAAALSNMFTNVTGFSLGFGLSSGIDTLGGQAFGASTSLHLSFHLLVSLTVCLFSFRLCREL